MVQFVLQFLGFVEGRRLGNCRRALHDACVPEQRRGRIQTFVQFALQLALTNPQFVFGLAKRHPLDISVAKRGITAPFRSVWWSALGRAQFFDGLFKEGAELLGARQPIRACRTGDERQQRMRFEVRSIVEMLKGIFHLFAEFWIHLAQSWRGFGGLAVIIAVY